MRAVYVVVRTMCAVGSVVCATLLLVRGLMRPPRLVMRPPSTLSGYQAWSVGRDRKLFVPTPPLQTLSRHKIFCHDRNGPALGKLYRDTRGPLSLPKHPIVTQNFYRDTGPKISVATQTTQYAWEPYRNTKIPVVTQGQKALSRTRPICTRMLIARPQAGSCSWPENPVATWKTQS